jgi:hypothetical protein
MKDYFFELCESRHPIPEAVDGAIFPHTVALFDFISLFMVVLAKFLLYDKTTMRLNVYVSGATSALVEVINYCDINQIPLILLHYDRDKQTYHPQPVMFNRKGV